MQWEGIVVSISLFIGLGLLISDKVSAEVVFLCELVFFWNLNIINSEEALNGFSNKGLITIGTLYIIVYPLNSNKYLNIFFKRMLTGSNMKISMIKTCSIVALLSAFMNNTPLVQLLTPIIRKYSRQNHFPSSRFLMPISFASIIGGMMTLIGTSTNIIIISLLPGDVKIGFFDTAVIGLPIFFCYLIYNYFFNEKLLPIRSGLFREIKNNFFITIKNNGDINTIIEDFEIEKGDIMGNYRNGTITYGEDILSGEYLCIKINPEIVGRIISEGKYEIMDIDLEGIQETHNIFYECVVGNISEIDKKTFEHKYNCKILASRQMESEIKKGTTLLVLTSEDFYRLWHNSNDFYMISLFNQEEINSRKMPILIFIVMIGLTTSNIITIEKAVVSSFVLYIILKIINIKEALNMVNYSLLLVIGCSFGISNAMVNSGISKNIAELISNIGKDWWTTYIIVQLIAQILTEVISNNAVAALMTQIVIDICRENNYNLRQFIIGLMVSCSCSFVTPYGYATNMIIQGSGGYKFLDYVRYGGFVKIIGFFISFLAYYV